MSGIFLIINIVTILLSIAVLIIYSKKQKKLFVLALIYATLFENINMLLSRGQEAGYSYNHDFVLFIFDTPLFVILSWAILITTSFNILKSVNENIKTSWWLVLQTSLLVLLIDLSVDVFAIRFNFWQWNGYELSEGFFGVPAINYVGWFAVTFIFLLFYKFLSKKKWLLWLVPFISYIFVLPIIGLYKEMSLFFNINKLMQIIFVFSGFAVLYLLIIFFGNKKIKYITNKKMTILAFVVRLIFHSFSLYSIIVLRINYLPLIFVFIIFLLLDFILLGLKKY